jgi:hypothetical protein
MDAPGEFQRRLATDFNGRLRIRWSRQLNQWQIEEKVGRASMPATPRSPKDNWIRAHDGYSLVLTVAPGDREQCQGCGNVVRLPTFDFAETKCDVCGKLTRSCYWPLTDILLEHLRKIDPLRDGPSRLRDEADAATKAAAIARQKQASNAIKDLTMDQINQIGGNFSVGYTGREAMWEN